MRPKNIILHDTVLNSDHITVEERVKGPYSSTGRPKKQVTLFVKAIIFKPRIARGWYYTYFEADPWNEYSCFT